MECVNDCQIQRLVEDKAYTVQVLATITHCHKTYMYVANSTKCNCIFYRRRTARLRYLSLQCMYSTRPLVRTGTHGRACISSLSVCPSEQRMSVLCVGDEAVQFGLRCGAQGRGHSPLMSSVYSQVRWDLRTRLGPRSKNVHGAPEGCFNPE